MMEEIIYYDYLGTSRLEFIVVKDGKDKIVGYKIKSQRITESESVASFVDFEKAVQCYLELFINLKKQFNIF
jgi:hypothetical protein